ncbi:GntR family transcriptional regulator [Streptomyces corynorhini]|uniref:GntR family transcriptional regulator n=1 Tax=Streptomyces corynorhini TaxID=2282652 RepID=UPI00389AF884
MRRRCPREDGVPGGGRGGRGPRLIGPIGRIGEARNGRGPATGAAYSRLPPKCAVGSPQVSTGPEHRPPETKLIERYGGSQPTVRKAISALRAEGLVDVIQGKGCYAGAVPATAVTFQRTVSRSSKTFRTSHHEWQQSATLTV